MKKLLLDTDVVLDFLLDRQPFAEQAAQILALCEEKKLQVFVTPVLISNVYYILRKLGSHNKVITHLKQLLTLVEIASIQKAEVLEALASDFVDFEDALQHFAAKSESGMQLIITRNLKDYSKSSIAVMMPSAYLLARKVSGG
jgi:predicted nucleic acid-binding protein